MQEHITKLEALTRSARKNNEATATIQGAMWKATRDNYSRFTRFYRNGLYIGTKRVAVDTLRGYEFG